MDHYKTKKWLIITKSNFPYCWSCWQFARKSENNHTATLLYSHLPEIRSINFLGVLPSFIRQSCSAGAAVLEMLSPCSRWTAQWSAAMLLLTHQRLYRRWTTGGARGLWNKWSNQIQRNEVMTCALNKDTGQVVLNVATASCFFKSILKLW